jgi:hypothetical protein
MSSPFTLKVPDSALELLRKKLELSTFPEQLGDAQDWHSGAPVQDIKRLASYWQSGFDWRKAESEINQLPQYKAPIDVDGFGPIDLHYVFQKSEVKNAIPLLFCHGCMFP